MKPIVNIEYTKYFKVKGFIFNEIDFLLPI